MAQKKLIDDTYHYKIVFQQLAENEFVNTDISDFDFSSFSSQKKLFDYQIEAMQNALRVLLTFFDNFKADKKGFYQFCCNKYPHENLDYKNPSRLIQEYYPVIGKRIDFFHFINRMSFWMTMGSGKTILIIKLIEFLGLAMEFQLIPKKNILFFTANEGLLNRFYQELDEYNLSKERKILPSNLKDYENIKRCGNIFEYKDTRIFCYRSDLLGEERKENILNFRDCFNDGNNYIILDEAHKGDKQDSVRQNIFSILSQNGFLFNFSATFTDPSDIATTIYNLNQAVWIQKGYGKKLFLLDNDLRAFREKTDLNEIEKQKATLKSLLLLALAKKNRIANSYHNPMMVVFTNSVNVAESDAELFFRTLQSIARDNIAELFNQSRKELKEEFKTTKYLITDQNEEGVFELSKQIEKISFDELKEEIFYAKKGNIEAIINPKDHQEIVFKLDTTSQPFCLIKIGDISAWLKEKLSDIKIDETYREQKYFDTLDESSINILIGSRSFYEGWDSTRPNIMLFLNIGMDNDSLKYVTQSLGRGMRIESIRGNRKRMSYLEAQDRAKIRQNPQTLETLFVVSTNKNAINSIIDWQKKQNIQNDWIEISLEKNKELEKEKALYIPIYKTDKVEATHVDHKKGFRLSQKNREDLRIYANQLGKSLFALKYGVFDKKNCDILFELLQRNQSFSINNNIHYKSIDTLIEKLKNKTYIKQSKVKGFKALRDEIIHFKKIKVREDKNQDFLLKINEVLHSQQLPKEEIIEKLKRNEITLKEAQKLEDPTLEFDEAKIKKILNHCYIPTIYGENLDWVKHVITERSEIEFLENLEAIYKDLDKKFQWWAFSRVNPHYDKDIFIPYTQDGEEKSFYPDFIFWLQEKERQTILFVDPKGTVHTDYQAKIDGYEKLFLDINEKIHNFTHESMIIQVKLAFIKIDNKDSDGKYGHYWYSKDDLERLFEIKNN